MSTAQKLGVGVFYAAVAVLGAAYALFEHHQAHLLVSFIKEMMPSFLILLLVFVIHGSLRTAVSVFKELNGVSRAAQAVLHSGYGKK